MADARRSARSRSRVSCSLRARRSGTAACWPASRDIKPANLLVRDGHLLLIDVAFVEARPSPWRRAVDLANMLLCLALRSSPEQVYRRTLEYFTVEEITEGFVAARGLALPSQLRHLLRTQGRNLHAEFVRLLPAHPSRNKVAVQTPLNIHSLAYTDLEPLWLQAQAVPSASLVPCVRYLPVGWSIAEVAVNNGRSVITWTTIGPAPAPWWCG